MSFDRIAASIPEGLARPLSIIAGLMAATGALLVFAATAYASWVLLIPAAAVFALAAGSWQVADRMGPGTH